MRNLEVWYTRFEIEKLMPQLRSQVGGKMRKRLDKAVAKAFRRDSVQAFSKLSRDVDGERRIVSDPPLIVRLDDFPDTEERDAPQGRRGADPDRLQADAAARAADPARPVPARRPGAQGGRRRQRRHGGLGRAVPRPGRPRPALPADQGGPALGDGGVRRRAATTRMRASASSQGSGSCRPRATSSSAGSISRRASSGRTRDYYVRQLRDWKGSIVVEAMDPRGPERLRAALRGDARARPCALRRPDRDRELPRLRQPSSTGRFSPSAKPMPSRTTATMRPCSRRVKSGRADRRPRASRCDSGLGIFDGGENLAGAIYGTILVTSVVAAADSSDAIWRSLGIVEVTVLVFWLAHVYAHALAWSLDSNEPFSRRGLRPVARKEWPLLQAAVVPTIALVAGGIGLISHPDRLLARDRLRRCGAHLVGAAVRAQGAALALARPARSCSRTRSSASRSCC